MTARGQRTVLVDDNQHMYLMAYDVALVVPNCPTNYWWTKARDPKARVAQRVVMNPDEEERFPELPASEIPPAASMDTQLDYAFYSLRKGVQARIMDQKLECAKICVLGNQESMEFSLRAQYLTLAWETMLYSLRCHQQEVQPAIDWDRHVCFKELPVWWDADKPHQKLCFLTHDPRLLLNCSQLESCVTDSQVLPGYPAILGQWVALTQELQLLRSPQEAAGTSVIEKNGSTKTRGRQEPYQEGTLFRWAKYHQNQFWQRFTEQILGPFAHSIFCGRSLQGSSTT